MVRNGIRLDDIDHSILSLLILDGSLKNNQLAQRVGLAPSSCLARVRRLECHGFIVGYRAIVVRSGPGVRVESLASVRFPQLTPNIAHKFGQLIEAVPEIIEAHRIAGQHDYLLRFCAGDMSAWNNFRHHLEALDSNAVTQLDVFTEAVK